MTTSTDYALCLPNAGGPAGDAAQRRRRRRSYPQERALAAERPAGSAAVATFDAGPPRQRRRGPGASHRFAGDPDDCSPGFAAARTTVLTDDPILGRALCVPDQ